MHLYIYFWSEIFIYLCTYFLSDAIEAEAIADKFRLEAKQRQAQGGRDRVSQEYKAVVQKTEQPVKPR